MTPTEIAAKVRFYAQKKSDPRKSRVLVIDPTMSWDELLQFLSLKFNLQVTQVALEVNAQQVEIDDVSAIHVCSLFGSLFCLCLFFFGVWLILLF